MKIVFHSNQLSYRGTTNAIFNYAYYNEKLLNNESVILFNATSKNNDESVVQRFTKHFKVLSYSNTNSIEEIVKNESADIFYAIKAGKNDGIFVNCCKTVIHSVFKYYEPHGDIYAYVSKWLSNEMTSGKSPYIPHMIHVQNTDKNLRKTLNIPDDAIVFGRHGGAKTFNLKFVQKTIKKIASKRKDIYFIFMGTNSFVSNFSFKKYKNIIFLKKNTNPEFISSFINTCDAYLHARKQGESFGIAIGEFSIKNKPIITWGGSDERSHIEILGEKAIIYQGKDDLYEILTKFQVDENKDWDAYSNEYSAIPVMKKFEEVILNS